jgi:threonine/homoserine/homoserine lactone efflux protein
VKYVAAILPSAGVVFLFWLAIRAVFEADRRERAAEARERRAAREAGHGTEGHSPV